MTVAWLSSDRTTTRLATASRDQLVQVWNFDGLGNLHNVFSIRLPTTVPSGVAFVENATRDIHVFGLIDGRM